MFRKFQEKLDVIARRPRSLRRSSREAASVFDSFDAFEVDSTEWWFFRRMQEMDLITVYPLLLWTSGSRMRCSTQNSGCEDPPGGGVVPRTTVDQQSLDQKLRASVIDLLATAGPVNRRR